MNENNAEKEILWYFWGQARWIFLHVIILYRKMFSKRIEVFIKEKSRKGKSCG